MTLTSDSDTNEVSTQSAMKSLRSAVRSDSVGTIVPEKDESFDQASLRLGYSDTYSVTEGAEESARAQAVPVTPTFGLGEQTTIY